MALHWYIAEIIILTANIFIMFERDRKQPVSILTSVL